MSESPVFNVAGDDPAMVEAYRQARVTFRYFWRELSWERRRIVPGLDMYAVKVAFKNTSGDGPNEELMWVTDLEFTGIKFKGLLLNEPQWVTKFSANDEVAFSFKRIKDWMYASLGRVYGGFSVNAMRATMSRGERAAHDKAWGLDFGDPGVTEVINKPPTKKGLGSLFKKQEVPTDEELMKQEHPMCLNMVESLREALSESNEILEHADEYGNTMLHTDSFAGNAPAVAVMLEFGGDRNQNNIHGQTPMDLAKLLGWKNVMRVLEG